MERTLIYDTAALYSQHMDERAQGALTEFYASLLEGYGVRTVHDCSIGAGGSTLPLARLGIEVSGSDISENLLSRARQNFADHGVQANLFLADFREVGSNLPQKVDCLISTGNSLPHVNLEGFHRFLASAHTALNEDGLLFFDIRNWDAIARERPVMHVIDPKVMTAQEHKSVYLLFGWHDDGSVTFRFVTATDRDGKHERLDFVEVPRYYPLHKGDILNALQRQNYELIRFVDMDHLWLASGMEYEKTGDFETDFNIIQWYGVLARAIR